MNSKTVLITGAGSGIGRATAIRFAQENARLILVSKTQDHLDEVSQLCKTYTQQIITECFDVSDENKVNDFFKQGHSFDIAVNNAGIEGAIAETINLTLHDFDRIISHNVRSLWQFLQAEVLHFRTQNKKGNIVNVASVAGILGIPQSSLYCMSKHAVIGLTKSVALEQIAHGIRVNSICPGAVDTPMLSRVISAQEKTQYMKNEPIGRMAQAAEIADAIFWLASEKSSYVVGHSLVIDGGISID